MFAYEKCLSGSDRQHAVMRYSSNSNNDDDDDDDDNNNNNNSE